MEGLHRIKLILTGIFQQLGLLYDLSFTLIPHNSNHYYLYLYLWYLIMNEVHKLPDLDSQAYKQENSNGKIIN